MTTGIAQAWQAGSIVEDQGSSQYVRLSWKPRFRWGIYAFLRVAMEGFDIRGRGLTSFLNACERWICQVCHHVEVKPPPFSCAGMFRLPIKQAREQAGEQADNQIADRTCNPAPKQFTNSTIRKTTIQPYEIYYSSTLNEASNLSLS